MEYNECKKIKKRMEAARKFIRISSTMMRAIDSELSENGIVGTGVNHDELSYLADCLDNYIKRFSKQHVTERQLSLFTEC